MRPKGTVDIIDSKANDLYHSSGTRQNLYGLFNLKTLEWHGGGPAWNPIGGLIPSALHKTVEEASIELALLGGPEWVRILHVMAVFMPLSIVQEEDDGSL